MVRYFNINKKLLLLIFFNFCYSLFLNKMFTFQNILFKLERTKKKYSFLKINDSSLIFQYERKISNIFRIDKCLISSICLYKTCKELGLKTRLIIGVDKENDINLQNSFKSHAWVEIEENTFFQSNNSFKKIFSIE
tara:strand:- start:93 stop:500 length:408 start_codon:yes stop_codon:yes gene_type:complete